jgi:hypothetical protein
MTVDPDERRDDDVLASLAALRTCDVSERRSRHLRRRCHAVLQADTLSRRRPWTMSSAPFREVIVPALGGAWCLVYLVEIIRRAAAIYGYLGIP